MEYKICKLKPKTPFHIGTKEGSLEESLHYIPSDTLFSAFCNVYRLVYGKAKLEELLYKFKSTPPFILSSIFPCINGKPLFPLPKNIVPEKLKIGKDAKKAKRIEFVDEDIFKKLLKGEEVEINHENIIQDKIATKEKKEAIWKETERPRVVIDRISSSSEIYYFGEVVFLDELYFLIDLKDDAYEEEITTTISVLGDEGIGGDRTYGMGLFELEGIDKIVFDEIDTEWHIILSMFYPKNEELKGLKGYFELVERGGWVYSLGGRKKRRKFVRMFKEGSVFNKKVVGDIVEVARDEHTVYRNGYAFTLPIKVEE